ncbi:DegT/DnrJ/EryC1/StrS aminotransferase family protein [Campylobacter sputorum subsp. bubulus]|uniref:DegT/DnrJ/EryC1/StrS aminotransferase family protein n=1 Tax=Campylobacter sputorum subsp. sputorum TaxID=32024 RepID=A0A381DJ54_9BACT|nr:LegC family aminotransferase [Campylobacter sputorum]ASM35755.1 aminotransferase, DegT/DnrJ/EryC1/StrS family [Campylobacter sputorum aubsp. sputorum RM3237]KAB0581459.1 LegC family aminotransferase [Campylobacter sputorum subsp. sputorum]QEL05945.1 aminotransferase, DegT/DnrJ/EryC1/StrS family [Campylobacter sputorum subsp. sputorum]SUX09042.1 DegT/DnrJ/EryC1/StrS aminotransferase family protein [Campylobacter sputorum subsp. bubulus]SUX10732.1 DegT/DnrJ/EryC1/StrS aminotransferase family 
MFDEILDFIRSLYPDKNTIALHEPRFIGNEKKYLLDCIDSTFVSSVGKYVDEFELKFADIVGRKFAVATTNGTSALHIALKLLDIKPNDEIITQPLTFVATCNAISYVGTKMIFLDVDMQNLSLSPKALERFLEKNCEIIGEKCINKTTKNIIKACVIMHTFGFPCKVDEIDEICRYWHIDLIEDAAESLGSYYKDKHTGSFGKIGTFSFNGNKIITSGGGGAIVCDDEKLAKRAKHLTTTAKIPHPYEYIHDEIGYNYRLPNLNAALLVAQLENLDKFLVSKRELAMLYKEFFAKFKNITFIDESSDAKANFWLNAICFDSENIKNGFLRYSNENGVFTRRIWRLMSELEMFKHSQQDELKNAKILSQRVANLPSSARI